MATTAHSTVGLLEIPGDGPWSADALVKESLGVCTYVWDQERVIIAGRVPAASLETARLSADTPRLRSELEELFERMTEDTQ